MRMPKDVQTPNWIERFYSGFVGMPETEQISLVFTVLGGISFLSIVAWLGAKLRGTKRPSTAGSQISTLTSQYFTIAGLDKHIDDNDSLYSFRWLYQWEVGDNVLPRAVDPPPEVAIAQEIAAAARQGKDSFLIFIRGELGIGKTTLLSLMPEALKQAAAEFDEGALSERNFVRTATLIEAGDLTRPEDFSSEVNGLIANGGAVVVLARPATLDIASRRIPVAPDKVLNILPFEPTGPLFHECLSVVADRMGLTDVEGRKKLGEIASQFDRFLKTPFYFEQAARALRSDRADQVNLLSPLDVFRLAIEDRANSAGISFEILLNQSMGQRYIKQSETLPGITGSNRFLHDGYRNVIIASGVVSGKLKFDDAVRSENAIPAIRIVLSHIESNFRRDQNASKSLLAKDIKNFITGAVTADQRHFPIYVSGLAAASFRRMMDENPAESLRQNCLNLVKARGKSDQTTSADDFSVWWDVSDALSEIGDPRLRRAVSQRFSASSGYWCEVPKMNIAIGNNVEPIRTDHAKPVLSYKSCNVDVGPFRVGRFLVTNEQFLEFWDSSDQASFFTDTGRQWIEQDPELLNKIEEIFDLSAQRNFWKEMSEVDSVSVGNHRLSSISPLDLGRKRATQPHHKDQVPLWDPINADQRFSAKGQPVVGINWWEAIAFCLWWERTKLKDSGLPAGSKVNLLTDWEWEAVRRHYYEGDNEDDGDNSIMPVDRYPAHTRVPPESLHSGRIGNVMRPLHVGLALAPNVAGPTDMVGNVWEWTRSRVFGEIKVARKVDETFGKTTWSDVDSSAERTPFQEERDTVNERSDLHYRAVRGGSFFSRDAQAAWHPAYRLCDPPFSSYIDLGFRIAVYPPK